MIPHERPFARRAIHLPHDKHHHFHVRHPEVSVHRNTRRDTPYKHTCACMSRMAVSIISCGTSGSCTIPAAPWFPNCASPPHTHRQGEPLQLVHALPVRNRMIRGGQRSGTGTRTRNHGRFNVEFSKRPSFCSPFGTPLVQALPPPLLATPLATNKGGKIDKATDNVQDSGRSTCSSRGEQICSVFLFLFLERNGTFSWTIQRKGWTKTNDHVSYRADF